MKLRYDPCRKCGKLPEELAVRHAGFTSLRCDCGALRSALDRRGLVALWNRKRGSSTPDLADVVLSSRDLCAVTCGACGHAGTLEAWTSKPVHGETAPGVFQCPECRHAFERKSGRDRYGFPVCTLEPREAML